MPKKVLTPYKLIDAETMNADITSDAVNIQYIDNVSIQLIFTGTPTGTFEVHGSNDGGTTWTTIDFGTTISAAGAASNHLINCQQFAFEQVRVKYVFSSSTGSLNCYICGKTI